MRREYPPAFASYEDYIACLVGKPYRMALSKRLRKGWKQMGYKKSGGKKKC